MKTKIFGYALTFIVSAVCLNGLNSKNVIAKPKQVAQGEGNLLEVEDNYFKSVNKYSLKRNDGFVSFEIEDDLKNYYFVDRVSLNDELMDKTLLIKGKGLEDFGFMEFEFNIVDKDLNIEATQNVSGYSYTTSNGNKDYEFDINGSLIKREDLKYYFETENTFFGGFEPLTGVSFDYGNEGGGSSGGATGTGGETPNFEVPLAKIAETVLNKNDIYGSIADFFTIPSLDGKTSSILVIVLFLMYCFKLKK